MKRDIPKSFEIGSFKYRVEVKKKVVLEKEEVAGTSDFFKNEIEIAKTIDKMKCSSDFQRQTFYHELVHTILDALGEDELCADERFVQRFSLLLDQFEITKKF